LLEFNASVGAGTTARLNDYVSLALLLPLGFGISFQLPLVMLIADRLGMASPRFYLEHWKVAVLVEAFLSMILTPSGDVTSMLGMFLPLVLLYFFGIGLCKWIPRSNNMAFEGYDPVG
jgi:sec-independent protein translocase protein TatC